MLKKYIYYKYSLNWLRCAIFPMLLNTMWWSLFRPETVLCKYFLVIHIKYGLTVKVHLNWYLNICISCCLLTHTYIYIYIYIYIYFSFLAFFFIKAKYWHLIYNLNKLNIFLLFIFDIYILLHLSAEFRVYSLLVYFLYSTKEHNCTSSSSSVRV